MRLPFLAVPDVTLLLECSEHREHGRVRQLVGELLADFGNGCRTPIPEDGHDVELALRK